MEARLTKKGTAIRKHGRREIDICEPAVPNEWIIDAYRSVASSWEQSTIADTLVYIYLPLLTHYWWVTKRRSKACS
jgi:hypothetical protein